MTRIATITPIQHPELSPVELTAMASIKRFLGDLPNFVVAARNINLPGFVSLEFDPRWFRSGASLHELFLTRNFYEHFGKFDFLFIARPDRALAGNRLEEFLRYDYTSSPCPRGCNRAGEIIFAGAGGGPFSLRRTASILRIFDRAGHRSGSEKPLVSMMGESDEGHFWARRAPLIDPAFTVSPTAAAQDFANAVDPTSRSAKQFARRESDDGLPLPSWPKVSFPFAESRRLSLA